MTEVTGLLLQIESAFRERGRPDKVLASNGIADEIWRDASVFAGLDREQLTCDLLHRCQDAMYGLSPEGYCYYLPGVMAVSLRDQCWDSIAVDSILHALDRGTDASLWNDYFKERWCLLKVCELRSVQAWILWLVQSGSFDEIALGRAFDVVDFLASRAAKE